MNDDVLEDVLKHKHLGINFCPNGTWKDHINEIYKKACSRLYILRIMKHNLDRNSLEKLYLGFIRPILEYGSLVWIIAQENSLILLNQCNTNQPELLHVFERVPQGLKVVW